MSEFDETTWRNQLSSHRAEKDQFLGSHPQSPIPDEDRDGFEGLDYYPPDPAYRVTATVETHDDPETVVMETTADTEAEYHRVATLRFEIGDTDLALAAYHQPGQDQLFVPFTDETTGTETYGHGRYLDVEATPDELTDGAELVVDFNLAYSPFCAYSHTYACPITPEENHLDVSVTAGEKDWNAE